MNNSILDIIANSVRNKYIAKNKKLIDYTQFELPQGEVLQHVIYDGSLTPVLNSPQKPVYNRQVTPAFGYVDEVRSKIVLVSSYQTYIEFKCSNIESEKLSVIVIHSVDNCYDAIRAMHLMTDYNSLTNYQSACYALYFLDKKYTQKEIAHEWNMSDSYISKLIKFTTIDSNISELLILDALTFDEVSDIHKVMKLKNSAPEGYEDFLAGLRKLMNDNKLSQHKKITRQISKILKDNMVKPLREYLFLSDEAKIIKKAGRNKITLEFSNVDQALVRELLAYVKSRTHDHYAG
ncbi:hypothetical protein AB4542_12275 [Vibrio breoganii]